jgi:6-phosphofructokinase 1
MALPAGGDGPLLLLVPEVHFSQRQFIAAVRARVEKHGWCAIAVAEGLCLRDGRRLTQAGGNGIPGHEQLGGVAPLIAAMVRGALGLKVHWSVLDYVQRAARHLASKTDLEQAYAVGRAALDYALQGKTGVMPVIQRMGDRPYRWRIVPAPLAGLMNREKRLPRSFLTADGYRLTARARRYFAPLIRGEAWQPYRDGLPLHAKLGLKPLARRLQSGWPLPPPAKK